MPDSYDQIPYPSLPFRQTHPERLATLAILFGLQPAPADRSRVLEIGCADGGNLIPMACNYPGSTFLGIDTAKEMVRAGCGQIAALGLANIRLIPMDVMDAGPALGEFDYILAHGFYSWVPEPVRDKLLAAASALLAPQGVAYVSYNALPGCHIRRMFREMLLFHVRETVAPDARIQADTELLACFTESPQEGGEFGSILKTEARFLLDQNPAVLFHDELAEIYHPVYVHEFLAHASRHGMRFLAESNYHEMASLRYPRHVIERVKQWTAGDTVLRQLYADFLKCRTFRQTLLCHEALPVSPEPLPDRIHSLYAASSAEPVSREPDLREGVAEEFRGYKGAAAKTDHPLAKAALLTLSRAWPQAVAFPDLLAAAGRLTGAEPDPGALTEILIGTYGAGLSELHSEPARCISAAGPFPQTTPLVRWQAAQGKIVTTCLHTTIEATGETERRLLQLLDGTRNLAALTAELQPLLDQPEEMVAAEIRDNLARLARFGLLVA